MAGTENHPPGIFTLLRKVVATGMGAVQNRAELLAVEWQEERARLAEICVWAIVLVFFGMMATILATATIIFLFPENLRIYATIGFAFLFLLAAVGVGFLLKRLLQRDPFPETLDQTRKDRVWLESLG